MEDKKEMLIIVNKNIYDKSVKKPLIQAIVEDRWNVARLISDELTERFPYNKPYRRLDDLILNKFYE